MEHLLWTERYRPKTVEDCILPSRLKQPFQEYVNQKQIPNLLLTGGSGVGNFGTIHATGEGQHGQPHSASISVPPLGSVWFKPAKSEAKKLATKKPATKK